MNHVSWQSVTPQFDKYQTAIEGYASINPQSFLEVQPRLKDTLSKFGQLNSVLTNILVVNAKDQSEYRALIAEGLQTLFPSQATVHTESLDLTSLLDKVEAKDGEVIRTEPGLISQAQNGFLVIPANAVLLSPVKWSQVKMALSGKPVSAHNVKDGLHTQPPMKHDFKLVIVGDREQLGELEYLDDSFSTGFSLFGEIEYDLHLDSQSIERYLGYVKWLSDRYQLPPMSTCALPRLLTAGVRQTEDQSYLPLSVHWHHNLLSLSALEKPETIRFEHIDAAIDKHVFRSSYLPNRALDDILHGQVIIETKDQRVGQINGLTVIDVPGHPESYGEPARISCVIHFGDGDISDVERKAELGGNLHAKGMMIMQAFLSSELRLDEPLPYSASIVFEQSYCEVDGDSASLAELCCLVSALTEFPIDQQIAVTGAVDQFGRVQAVGGLNEKIEGFYRVCRHQGFTGKQGVILPQSNLKHLALHKDVVNSIQNGEFHVWSVATVDEALPIILGKPFRGEEDSVIAKIAERIENFERHEQPLGLVDRLRNWFV